MTMVIIQYQLKFDNGLKIHGCTAVIVHLFSPS